MPEGMEQDAEILGQFDAIFDLCGTLDDDYFEKKLGYKSMEDLPRKTFLHLWMRGVHPDFGRRGIGRELGQRTINYGKANGYKQVISESVSQYTLKINKR